MGAPLRLTPTKSGKKILSVVLSLHGSIQQAARTANVSEHTLRRRIYRDSPTVTMKTVDALEGIGIPRALLLS